MAADKAGCWQHEHLVNGKWLTTRQAAEALGVKIERLYNWRSQRRRDRCYCQNTG